MILQCEILSLLAHALVSRYPIVHGSGLSLTCSRHTRTYAHRGSYSEMENMREEDGFQEAGGEKGRRKGETGPKQTSEGKQKLMKQDVTIDGSLHPSKHGTLAGSVLTPSSSSLLLFLFCLRQGTTKHALASVSHYYFVGSVAIILTVQQITAIQCSCTPNWPSQIHIRMCLRLQVN